MPLTASEFIQRIESHLCEFGIDTDSNKESIDFSESFYIKAFDIGGMSGGQVSISWWRAEGMPLIKERLSGIEFEGTSFDGRPETVASSHPTNIGVKSKAIFNDFTNKPKTKDWFSVRPHMVYLFEHVFNQLCAIYNPDKLSTQFIRSQNKHLPHLLFNLNAKTQEIADNPDSEFGNAIWIKPRYNSRKPTDQYIIHVEIAITFKEHQHHFISFHKGMKGLIEAIQRHKFKNFVFTDKVEGKEFVEVMTDNIASDHLELITQLNKVLSDSFSRFPRRQNDYRRLIHEMEKKHNITGVKYPAANCVASHIKPLAQCEVYEEAHDKFNGLWLDKRMGQLFDKGYITFTDEGVVIIGSQCCDERLNRLGLPRNEIHHISPLLSEQRSYMQYHREYVFKP